MEPCHVATVLLGLLAIALRIRSFLLNPVPLRLRVCKDIMSNGPSWFHRLLPGGSYHYCVLDDPRGRPERPVVPEQGHHAEGLDTVHVAYAANAQYFPLMLGSMVSLARHVGVPSKCVIHVIVPKEAMRKAEGMVGCWRRALSDLGPLPRVVLRELLLPHYLRRQGAREVLDVYKETLLAHSRIYLATDYLPTVRRVLWLDADTTIKADITPLYRMHMDHAIAATPDSKVGEVHNKYDLPWLGRLHKGPYFCSGVLLMELRLWRLHNFTAAVEKVGFERQTILTQSHHEQPVLNFVFSQRHHVLDWRWHLQLLNSNLPAPKEITDQARILHWNGLPEKIALTGNKSRRGKTYANDHLYDSPGVQCEALQ